MGSLLLVDDQPGNLLSLRAVLEPLGHELVEARSGRDALRFLLDRQFSAVLLDVRMPGMDGLETASIIRARQRTHGLPILFISSATPDENALGRGYAEGAADYLVRPFDPGTLRAKVQALVAAQQGSASPAPATHPADPLERATQARAEAAAARKEEAAARKAAAAARKEAAEATRIKDQFLATLSHELRTPLMSILGWTRLLRLGKASADPAGRALQSIERNARLQAQLVEDLLDVQRVAAGKMSLSFREVPFGRAIEAQVALVRPEAEKKGIALRAAVPADEELFVFGDEDRLKQIVALLLKNAIAFTPAGGHVRVLLSTEDTELLFTVSDDGSGMAADFLPVAFEPFTQEDARLTREHGGLGLGLYTVRGLVELHGGTISAQSPGRGKGSSFLVSLPLRSRAPRPFAPAGLGAPPPAPSGTLSLQGVSILVVEDDPDAQYLIATMLEQFGGRVTATGSAAEAVRALGASRFDLLLSDISMPGEDGYSLIRRVRANDATARLAAVALTANARPEDRAKALAAGFHAHLAKPIEPAELAAALSALVPAGRGSPRA